MGSEYIKEVKNVLCKINKNVKRRKKESEDRLGEMEEDVKEEIMKQINGSVT